MGDLRGRIRDPDAPGGVLMYSSDLAPVEVQSPYLWYIDVLANNYPVLRLYRSMDTYNFGYPCCDHPDWIPAGVSLPERGTYTKAQTAEFVQLIQESVQIGSVHLRVLAVPRTGEETDHFRWVLGKVGDGIPHHPDARVWFVPGQTYYYSDWRTVVRVLSRTLKMITYEWNGEIRRSRVFLMDGVECIQIGKYTYAPIYRADRPGSAEDHRGNFD